MSPEELENRLIHFAVSILQLSKIMPDSYDARHIANQFVRSGTHPGIHYGEVRGASSTRDFIHKLKMINKELRETHNSLRITELMKYVPDDKILPVLKESNELIAIFTATIKRLELKTKK